MFCRSLYDNYSAIVTVIVVHFFFYGRRCRLDDGDMTEEEVRE